MKQIYPISRMGFLVLAMGFLSPSILYALVPYSVGGSNAAASSIYAEEHYDKNLALFRASLLKSSGASQLLTDSMVVYNNYADGDSSQFHKVIYEYQPDNLLALVYYYQRNSEKSDWEGYQKEVFQFNASIDQTNFTVYLKSASSNEWIHQMQRIYSYDTNNLLSAVAEYQWSESTSAWVGQWMQEIDQNSAQLIRSKINLIWNAVAHNWSPLLKQEFDYHTNGELFRSISYAYNVDNTLWEGQQKSEMDYVNGLLDTQTDYFWDLNASPATWVASNKKVFQYNELGEQFSWKWYRWNRDFSLWEEWWKIEHSEDEATNTTTWSDAQWDSANEAWISSWRVDTKGEKDKPSEAAAYAWNNTSGSWQGMFRVSYIYGEEDQLQAKWDYLWDESYQNWRLNQKHFYFFAVEGSDPVGIFVPNENGDSGELKVYPNPSRHMIYIESSSIIQSLQLYAPDGRLVVQARPNEHQTGIAVQHLPAGLYIIKTGTASGTRFSKIVVK